MVRKFYIKKLTKSDLTIFDRYLTPQLKQEAIVLHKKFIETLDNKILDLDRNKTVPMAMRFWGPDAKGEITRANASIGRQVNDWRIQGSKITDPASDPERFAELKPGDLFVFSMDSEGNGLGDGLFVSENSMTDNPLFNALSPLQNKVIGGADIEYRIASLDLPSTHPIHHVLSSVDTTLIPDAAPYQFENAPEPEFMDSLSAGFLGATSHKAAISKAELKDLMDISSEIGSRGESLFNSYLDSKPLFNGHRVISHQWVAENYATAPYDFEAKLANGEIMRIELKSSNGLFETPIFISKGELREMASPDRNVVLARLYDIEGSASVRFCFNTRSKATPILESDIFLDDLVSATAYKVQPDYFEFESNVIELNAPFNLK